MFDEMDTAYVNVCYGTKRFLQSITRADEGGMMNFNHTVELKFGQAFLRSQVLGHMFQVSPFPMGLQHLFVVFVEPSFCLEKGVCLRILCALRQGLIKNWSWMFREGAAEREASPVSGGSPEPMGSYASV